MKKTKLTRSLLAACSIVALSAVMYGCTGDGSSSGPCARRARCGDPCGHRGCCRCRGRGGRRRCGRCCGRGPRPSRAMGAESAGSTGAGRAGAADRQHEAHPARDGAWASQLPNCRPEQAQAAATTDAADPPAASCADAEVTRIAAGLMPLRPSRTEVASQRLLNAANDTIAVGKPAAGRPPKGLPIKKEASDAGAARVMPRRCRNGRRGRAAAAENRATIQTAMPTRLRHAKAARDDAMAAAAWRPRLRDASAGTGRGRTIDDADMLQGRRQAAQTAAEDAQTAAETARRRGRGGRHGSS